LRPEKKSLKEFAVEINEPKYIFLVFRLKIKLGKLIKAIIAGKEKALIN